LILITYLPPGEKEVRAWTIRKGWKAPQAASVIHTDFERGFIKAEVIKLPDYEKYRHGSCLSVKRGKFAIEGKEYVVQDWRYHALSV
jgi:ribosome-binding ATPase YchF (GTP1/OBG family)